MAIRSGSVFSGSISLNFEFSIDCYRGITYVSNIFTYIRQAEVCAKNNLTSASAVVSEHGLLEFCMKIQVW
jgi:hypothetical protein